MAGAFAGHEAEEGIENWNDNRKEKKHEEERREHEHERRDERRDDYDEHRGGHGGYGGGPPRGGGDFIDVTVQPGDTLRGIAARFDHVSYEEIARHNRIDNPDMIYPGQVLQVPARR